MASGTYLYQPSYAFVPTGTIPVGTFCFALNGLAPATTYHATIFAAPNLGNNTDICNVGGCGAVDQTVTTPAVSSLAALPALPTSVFLPANPNVGGYTTITMARGGGGDCVAQNTAGPVTAGQAMQVVLNQEAADGGPFINSFTQSTVCDIPNSGGFGPGYILPTRAGGFTGYIILQTQGVTLPYRTRATPGVCAAYHYATLKATAQSGSPGVLGQVITSDYLHAGTQGYIVRQLILEPDQTINTGLWSMIFNVGNNGEYASDDVSIYQNCILGAPTGNTWGGGMITGLRTAFTDNYMAQLHSTMQFSIGIYLNTGGTGPLTIDNNYIEDYGEALYAEGFDGATCDDSDVTLTHNLFRNDLANINNGWIVRQQVEFKCGHRWNIQGNEFWGAWSYQNQGQVIYVSGTNNSATTLYGVSDITIKNNLIHDVPTVMDCLGDATADNGPGSQPPVTQRVLFQNNLVYNLGYAGRVAPGAGGSGAVNAYIVHRPGCSYFTVNHNTFGIQDPTDTRGLIDFIPVYQLVGGGSTLASDHANTNNIFFLNAGNTGIHGFAVDDGQLNSFRPRTPAITNGTPKQVLDTYSVAMTASVAASYQWLNNYIECGVKGIGGSMFGPMSNGDCATYQADMPNTALDTYKNAGTTIFASTAQSDYRFVGAYPTYAKTNVGGGPPGANIDAIYAAMGSILQLRPTAIGTTTAIISATVGAASINCRVGYGTSADVSTWTWTSADTTASRYRSIALSGLTTKTGYWYGMSCEPSTLTVQNFRTR